MLGNHHEDAGILPASAGMTPEAVRAEMAEIVEEAVAPHLALGVKAALTKAARFLGISPRRAEAYRWGEVRMISAWEADQLRARRAEMREARIQALEDELAALRAARRNPHGGKDDCMAA